MQFVITTHRRLAERVRQRHLRVEIAQEREQLADAKLLAGDEQMQALVAGDLLLSDQASELAAMGVLAEALLAAAPWVFVRGNHEDVTLVARYGFLAEGRAKFGRDFNAAKLLRAYDFLPVALYLGIGQAF